MSPDAEILRSATVADPGGTLQQYRDTLADPVPPPGATLDELRAYAERVSQKSGMATVIVAVGGKQREYVVTPEVLGIYADAVSGALVEALSQRQELLGEEAGRDT